MIFSLNSWLGPVRVLPLEIPQAFSCGENLYINIVYVGVMGVLLDEIYLSSVVLIQRICSRQNFETEKIDVVPNKRFLVVVWLRSALALLL